MNSYITQYKTLFYLVWISTCLIFPSWALPISTAERSMVFAGLIIYFLASAIFMNHCFNNLSVNKLNVPHIRDYLHNISTNFLMSVICFIAVALQIYSLSFPISLAFDEPTHLMGGVGLYIFINTYWEKLFNFPLQYASLILTALILFILITNKKGSLLENLTAKIALYKSNGSVKPLSIFFIIIFLVTYFLLMRNLPYHPNMVRFPPIGKILYLISYLFVGINPIGPRIWQLIFYVFSAIYLYRTIHLFRDKDTALLGASIFLFSPLVFYFAHRAELASGDLFFIILTTYYLLKFTKYKNNGDILLASLCISIGVLFKETVLLMFFICIIYLITIKLKNKEFHLFLYVGILSLSMIPVIPWMIIRKFYVWRLYEIVWSHLVSLDIMFSYLFMIPSQVSWIIFALFIFAIFFSLIKQADALSYFFALLFISYYLFYTADVMEKIDRFSMALYPTIAVFSSQFISALIRKINWRYSLRIISVGLTIHLILMCTIWQAPSLKAELVTYKNIESRYFPTAEAMIWVKDNIKTGENILILQVPPALFYRDKYMISRDKIIDFWYDLEEVSTPIKLKQFCNVNNISYIMFSYGPAKEDISQNKDMQNYLIANMDNKFKVVKQFNLDSNYIYIFSLHDI